MFLVKYLNLISYICFLLANGTRIDNDEFLESLENAGDLIVSIEKAMRKFASKKIFAI